MISEKRKRERKRFADEMKFLIVAGLFFAAGLFLIGTFFFTGVDHTVDDENWPDDNPLVIQKGTPKIHPLTNLEKGDVIYIEYRASDVVDIMVDSLKNCTRYIEEHASYESYDLPPEAYKVRAGVSGKFKVTVNSSEMGIVFQKSPYSGSSKVDLHYKVTYPDHFVSSCLIIGLMFMVGGAALVVIHFLRAKKQRRYEPLEPERDTVAGGMERSRPMPQDEPGKGKKGKGKKGGKKGKGKKGKKKR